MQKKLNSHQIGTGLNPTRVDWSSCISGHASGDARHQERKKMTNNRYTYISAFLLVACVPFEHVNTNVIYENLCPYKIGIYNPMAVPENFLLDKKEHKQFITHAQSSNNQSSLINVSYQAKNKDHKFHIENPNKHIYKMIARLENAKPIGDGNWIKAN